MTMRLTGLLALIAVLLFVCSTAQAQPRTHDGFYLRLGAGVGYVSDAVEETRTDTVPVVGTSVETNSDGTAQGFAFVSELAFGGVVGSSLVIGGGIYSAFVGEPEAEDVEVEGQPVDDIEFDNGAFHVVAPFIDYYVDPNAGLHFQAALGFGVLAVGDGNFKTSGALAVDDHTAVGLGLMVGLGYEWWVSDSWGLGVLGRLTGGFVSGENDEANTEWVWDHVILSPGILFTATMN